MTRPPALKAGPEKLPSDARYQMGGTLFLISLAVFFVASILLFAVYAQARRDDDQTRVPLPASLLVSTGCLFLVSGLVHLATKAVRRDKYILTSVLLWSSAVAGLVFVAIQFVAMRNMLNGPALDEGTGKGIAGMVAVLAFLHALHVAGGILALGIIAVRATRARYDHERHWPIDFTAQYWHFLDLVWICMLAAFWYTSGGIDW